MKLRKFLCLLAGVALVGGGFSGCSEDETESLPVEPVASIATDASKGTSTTTAVITLKTQNVSEYACLYYTEAEKPEQAPAEADIFAKGIKGTCAADKDTSIELTGLSPETTYVAYIALKTTEGNFYGTVLTATVTTEAPAIKLALIDEETKGTSATTAVITLQTKSISEYAYAVYTEPQQSVPTEAVLFATGTTGQCTPDKTQIELSMLDPLTSYTVYMAFKVDADHFYGEVLTATVTTTDIETNVALIEQMYDGFRIRAKVPQSVKDAKHVLRLQAANLAMYNMNKSGWMAMLDAEALEANGQKYFVNDTTIVYNNDNIYQLDENGDPMMDEFGNEIYNHDPIAPGEPLVFMLGEFGWGESMWGWGEGWYKALFDFDKYFESGADPASESEFWTGYFHKMELTAKEPSKLDGSFEIDAQIGAVTATINITPSANIQFFLPLVVDQATYQGQILPLINGREELMQWFTTSFLAAYNFGVQPCEGGAMTQIKLEDIWYAEADTPYKLFLVGMGDEEGTSQCFQVYDFTTKSKNMPAPEVVVTPLQGDDPYKVRFNVRATSGNAVRGRYLANYDREWGGMLASGWTYELMLSSYGNDFSAEEMAAINSSEGLDLEFGSMEDMVTRLAIICYNEEDTPNSLEEGSPAIAEVRSGRAPDAERVESSLFTDLEGEWTLSGTSALYDYYTQSWVESEQKTRVVISGVVSSPEKPTEAVYKAYETATTLSRDEVDKLYSEFKVEEKEYNAKIRGQNRLLCLGFGFETQDPEGYVTYRAFEMASPYELFYKSNYNSYNNEAIYYDFGPKWYLQINGDGTVTVPFNSTFMPPMNAWTDQVYYLAGLGVSDTGDHVYASVGADGQTLTFPVEVSADKNTITIKPLEIQGYTLYPTAMYNSYGGAQPASSRKNVSALTLTRGWSGDAATAPASVRRASAPAPVMAPAAKSISGREFKVNKTVYKTKTSFKNLKPCNKISITPVNKEQFEANMEKYMTSRGYRKVK